MFTISDDRSRVTWSPQILAAMHLPYKDLNLSSKVPWFHPVTPMETGADEGVSRSPHSRIIRRFSDILLAYSCNL